MFSCNLLESRHPKAGEDLAVVGSQAPRLVRKGVLCDPQITPQVTCQAQPSWECQSPGKTQKWVATHPVLRMRLTNNRAVIGGHLVWTDGLASSQKPN